MHTEFQYCEQFKLKKRKKNPHMISDLCLAHDRELSLVWNSQNRDDFRYFLFWHANLFSCESHCTLDPTTLLIPLHSWSFDPNTLLIPLHAWSYYTLDCLIPLHSCSHYTLDPTGFLIHNTFGPATLLIPSHSWSLTGSCQCWVLHKIMTSAN